MEFVVPKFIERELRIIGPLTMKQFAHLAFAGIICFFIYFVAPRPIFWFSVLFLGGVSLGLAFIKIEGRPIIIRIFNFFKFFVGPKLYIWKVKRVPFSFSKLKKLEKEGLSLEVGGASELKKIKKEVETKTEVETKVK
ncbi:hypothetical protein AMJ49_00330 [Parcubacteria bacterium DG_74_2]|nr:MAG: hypothetical protein AMJ49_00330 [Parcubacteria bacterium DG_74_2]